MNGFQEIAHEIWRTFVSLQLCLNLNPGIGRLIGNGSYTAAYPLHEVRRFVWCWQK